MQNGSKGHARTSNCRIFKNNLRLVTDQSPHFVYLRSVQSGNRTNRHTSMKKTELIHPPQVMGNDSRKK